MQLAASGTGVMMGNQKIMHITRHNAIDYSKSKARLRPRWEVEVAEGVDLLLVSFACFNKDVGDDSAHFASVGIFDMIY
jgi:hypothetical protein